MDVSVLEYYKLYKHIFLVKIKQNFCKNMNKASSGDLTVRITSVLLTERWSSGASERVSS